MIELHPTLAQRLLQAVPEGLALTTEDGIVLWANPAFAAQFGRSCAACLGKTLAELDPSGRWSAGATTQSLPDCGRGSRLLRLPASHTERDSAGVLTREALQPRLEAEISRSRRYANPLACLTVTLAPDQTDSIGPLSRFLRDQLRWVDVLAWWGDNELLVLLPETSGRSALALQRKLATRAAELLPGAVLEWGHSVWRRGDDAERFVERATHRERATLARLKERAPR